MRWDIVRLFTPGILAGSWVGPWIGKQMNPMVMALFFGIFVAVAATQMLIDTKPAGQHPMPGRGGMFAAGGGIGVLAGLVGAGGGFISIPFMTWFGVRIHQAVATSAALGFPIALAGTLANIWYGWGEAGLPAHSLGFVYLPALAIIATASVLMAPLGARTAHRWPVQRLRRVFAYILYCAGRLHAVEGLHPVPRLGFAGPGEMGMAVGPGQHQEAADDHRQRQHLARGDRAGRRPCISQSGTRKYSVKKRAQPYTVVNRAPTASRGPRRLARVQPDDDEHQQAVDQQLVDRRRVAQAFQEHGVRMQGIAQVGPAHGPGQAARATRPGNSALMKLPRRPAA